MLQLVNFDGYRMGDAMGKAYAAGLFRMVEQGCDIEELHLSNNNLGPTALEPLAEAIARCAKLRLLDLSGNPLLMDERPVAEESRCLMPNNHCPRPGWSNPSQ